MKRHLPWLALLIGAAACSTNDDKTAITPKPVVDMKAPAGGFTVNTAQWLRISPEVKHAEGASFVWTLGQDTVSLERELRHVFAAAGDTTFHLHVKTPAGETTQSVTVKINAQVYVNGVAKVFEYRPAPGQFINTLPAWNPGDTEEQVRALAESTLRKGNMICLGGFGGYVVLGFDHTIVNVPGAYNFQVTGNAFTNWAEPGVVQVSADVNGNGLPDDPWYEIAGSEHGHAGTVRDYEITYHRPAPGKIPTPNNDYPFITDSTYIRWTDNQGNAGYVSQNAFHSQDYFPGWLGDKLTFKGTKLREDLLYDQSGAGSYFVCPALDFGYADNHPNNEAASGIKISWAVDANGRPARLKGVDFIRIHTGMRAEGGWLGEISTEVSGVKDLNLK